MTKTITVCDVTGDEGGTLKLELYGVSHSPRVDASGDVEKHYPVQYTDRAGNRQFACACGGTWPCPRFTPNVPVEDDDPAPERRVLDLSHAGALRLIKAMWGFEPGRDLRVLDECLAWARREG